MMHFNQKITLLSGLLLLVNHASLDAGKAPSVSLNELLGEAVGEAILEVLEGPRPVNTAILALIREDLTGLNTPLPRPLQEGETTILARLGEDFIAGVERQTNMPLAPARPLENAATLLGRNLGRALGEGLGAELTRPIPRPQFGPKTLTEVIKENEYQAQVALSSFFARNNVFSSDFYYHICDLLWFAPRASQNPLCRAARRIASSVSWLTCQPSPLQAAIARDFDQFQWGPELVTVFKLHLANPEGFYNEINAQGLDDMNEATNTMRNLVDALFTHIETVLDTK